MIIKFRKAEIDTNDNHAQHEKDIKNHVHCEKTSPEKWWVEKLSDGNERFIHIHYNEEGDKVLKISSWDSLKSRYITRRVKQDQCYFSQKNEDCWTTETVIDHNVPSSANRVTWWTIEDGFTPHDIVDAPIIKETVRIDTGIHTYEVEKPRKKKWGIF